MYQKQKINMLLTRTNKILYLLFYSFSSYGLQKSFFVIFYYLIQFMCLFGFFLTIKMPINNRIKEKKIFFGRVYIGL